MRSKKQTERKNEIYSNCAMYDFDGIILCRCSQKRAYWYLKRDLAEILSKNPLHIKLKFNPVITDNREDFYSNKKKNVCCVCRSNKIKLLTKHHIVPSCFRQYFPKEYKCYLSHDIVPVCRDCHDIYHMQIKKIIEDMLQNDKDVIYARKQKKELQKLMKMCGILVRHGKEMPENKIMAIAMDIFKHTGEQQLNIAELFEETGKKLRTKDFKAEKIFVKNLNNIKDFVIFWRKNFVSIMKPKFLPEGWAIDNKVSNIE